MKTKLWQLLFLLVIILCTTGLGASMSIAIDKSNVKQGDNVNEIGEEIYLENCSECHIPLPPSILPTESWREILENPDNHYGLQLKNINRLTQVLMWRYFQSNSRRLNFEEAIPSLVSQSRYFKAFHPKVEFSKDVTHQTCIVCHPNAKDFDYLTLTPEWENSP